MVGIRSLQIVKFRITIAAHVLFVLLNFNVAQHCIEAKQWTHFASYLERSQSRSQSQNCFQDTADNDISLETVHTCRISSVALLQNLIIGPFVGMQISVDLTNTYSPKIILHSHRAMSQTRSCHIRHLRLFSFFFSDETCAFQMIINLLAVRKHITEGKSN